MPHCGEVTLLLLLLRQAKAHVNRADGGNQSLHCCMAANINGNAAGVTYIATISATAAAAAGHQSLLTAAI